MNSTGLVWHLFRLHNTCALAIWPGASESYIYVNPSCWLVDDLAWNRFRCYVFCTRSRCFSEVKEEYGHFRRHHIHFCQERSKQIEAMGKRRKKWKAELPMHFSPTWEKVPRWVSCWVAKWGFIPHLQPCLPVCICSWRLPSRQSRRVSVQ